MAQERCDSTAPGVPRYYSAGAAVLRRGCRGTAPGVPRYCAVGAAVLRRGHPETYAVSLVRAVELREPGVDVGFPGRLARGRGQ